MKRVLLTLNTALLTTHVACAQPQPSEHPYSVPAIDAPELAQPGNYAVGVQTLTITNPAQPALSVVGAVTGWLPKTDRALKLDVWYPAIKGTNTTRYETALPPAPGSKETGKTFSTAGIAYKEALPLSGKQFPLVIVSHGFRGWSTYLSYLTENLASKGYVVAAIEHADLPFDSKTGFALSFGSVMLNRAADQRFVMRVLMRMAEKKDSSLGRTIDAAHIGIIGYSMGGFGALATAGAGYDMTSKTIGKMPRGARAALVENDAANAQLASHVSALVTMAPWGGQPDNRSWSAASLAKIKAPVLMIVGDQDDIADYDKGISWIYANMTGANRIKLVYENARHNIAGNPPPAEALTDFSVREYFDEPVWRKDRIMAINTHFITAFLDRTLKNDVTKQSYLDVPTVLGKDAQWPTEFGELTNGKYADGTGKTLKYWKGFQRRYTIGLELHHDAAAPSVKP